MDKYIKKVNNEYEKYENNIKDGKKDNEKALNLFLKDSIESKTHTINNDYNMLYPSYNDPNFNVKISGKKEFYDIKNIPW